MLGYEASGWCGVVGPKGTPIEIINDLRLGLGTGTVQRIKRAMVKDALHSR